jgi:uncharacterized protein (DUF1330 family)
MEIHNRDWMDEYFSQVPALIEAHGGKFTVRGGSATKLEGPEGLPDAVFVLEFPDREHALSFWNSEKFAPLIKLRQTGSTLNAMLVDCLE